MPVTRSTFGGTLHLKLALLVGGPPRGAPQNQHPPALPLPSGVWGATLGSCWAGGGGGWAGEGGAEPGVGKEEEEEEEG